MIVNAPAVLALLLAAMELVAGTFLFAAALRGLRAPAPGTESSAEPLRPLALLLVLLVAVLAATSLLLWGLLLQSLVPQWADVRCVVGVLRVGSGARGPASWLPALADATTGLRAALVLAAGACAALHLAARDRPEGRLGRGHLLLLAGTGLLAVAAALVEGAWIVIPKGARDLSAGCCMQFPATTPTIDGVELPGRDSWRGILLYCGITVQALAIHWSWAGRPRRSTVAVFWVVQQFLVLMSGLYFVEQAVAPARLGLPLHHCLWCLAGAAPETVVGLLLLAAPFLAAAWRAAVVTIGPGEGPSTERILKALDRIALFGLLGGLAFFVSQRLAA